MLGTRSLVKLIPLKINSLNTGFKKKKPGAGYAPGLNSGLTASLDGRGFAAQRVHDQSHDKQHEEDHNEQACDIHGYCSHAAEAEYGRNKRKNEENDGIAEHDVFLFNRVV